MRAEMRSAARATRFARAACAAIALAVAASPAAHTQQFRSSTELVLVDVVATRVDGRLARDLTAADFEVFEDGRPQPIRQFEVVDLEQLSERNPDLSGVFTNAAEPGAIFAMVLDDMMLAQRHTRDLRVWARRFIDEHVRPRDYLAVVRSGADSGLLLTTDHDLVLPVIDQASGAISDDVSSLTGTSSGVVPTPGRDAVTLPDFSELGLLDKGDEVQAQRSLVMLQQMVEHLARVPGRRKAVLYFSQGVPFDLEALGSQNSGRTLDAMKKLLAAAREGNVAIYTIDPRGLKGSTEPATGATPAPAARDAGIDTLRDLATATGGRAFVASNDFANAFAQISEDNRFYYLLGYEPTSRGEPTRTRRIEVRSRVAGVELLHRRAYVPAAAGRTTIARAAETSPIPVTGLPIALAPTLFPDPKAGASLAVPFEMGQAVPDGTSIDYALVAVDARGRQVAGMKGTVKAGGGTATGLARLTLAPGRYQLRLRGAVADRGLEGVAFANVVVDAPGAAEPACGGFMVMQGQPKQVRPVVQRRARSDQPLMIATILSARALPEGAPLAFTVDVLQADKALVAPIETPQPLGTGRWRFELALPAPLPPGDMLITLTAGDQAVEGCRLELNVQR